MLVAQAMSTELVTVAPETPLKDAARLMLAERVSGLPVLSEGRLVGIITEADFVDQEAGYEWPHRYFLHDLLWGWGGAAGAARSTVGEAMTEGVVVVDPDTQIARAARLMVHHGVKRLPVVDDGRLVGIVSRADIMRVLVRSDADIASDVAAMIHRRLLPVDPEAITVTVSGGVVSLRGTVESYVDAQMLADIVERMDGVTRVDSALDWEVDTRIPEQRFPGYPQEGAEEASMTPGSMSS